MGAFNWILIDSQCPNCEEKTWIRFQTHIASDYDGDERGRFHDRVYRLNEVMNWWPPSHAKFCAWRVNGTIHHFEDDPEHDRECCYSECPLCKTDLYAVIRFQQNRPIELIEVGKIENWPSGYVK